MTTSASTETAALLDALAQIPDLEVSDRAGANAFAIDGQLPMVVVAPASVVALASAVRTAGRYGQSVVAWGSGAAIRQGYPPQAYGIAMETRRIAGILDHQPADLTVTCGAGTRLSALAAFLAPAGQFLPLDPPGGGSRTIGGVLASRASGPRRVARGHPRDLVLGMQVVLCGGQIVRTGGKVVKNVAGYDLSKLMIGSLGSLGVITEVTLRLYPAPVEERTLQATFATLETALSAAARIRALAIPVSALVVHEGAPAGIPSGKRKPALVVRMDGAPNALARRRALLAEVAPTLEQLGSTDSAALWRSIDHFIESAGDAGLVTRAAVLPSALPALCEELQATAAQIQAEVASMIDAGTGVCESCWTFPGSKLPEGRSVAEALARLRRALGGGSVIVETCPAAWKPSIDLLGGDGAGWRLMRRLKEQLDPGNLFAPGRLFAAP